MLTHLAFKDYLAVINYCSSTVISSHPGEYIIMLVMVLICISIIIYEVEHFSCTHFLFGVVVADETVLLRVSDCCEILYIDQVGLKFMEIYLPLKYWD